MKNSNIDIDIKDADYYDEEDEEFSNSNRQFIPFKKRGDIWTDVEPIPQFSDEVEILKIDYDPNTREINDYFRAILQKNEISMRAYDLTKEVIMVVITYLFSRPQQLITWLGIIVDSASII